MKAHSAQAFTPRNKARPSGSKQHRSDARGEESHAGLQAAAIAVLQETCWPVLAHGVGTTMSEPAAARRSMRDDEAFAAFFVEPFDAAAFSSSLIEADADAAYLKRLNGGIARLERDASAEVSANHEELVSHIERVLALEARLGHARERAAVVAASASRMQASLSTPCDRLREHAAELRRVYDACALLRALHRLLYLGRRLRELLEPEPTDLAMAAE